MNRICSLLGIQYPIIQGGMAWCSGWRLASAVSNAGGLGLIGAGTMYPEILREHIQKCKKATNKPFGVNVPLTCPRVEEIMDVIVEEGVNIVFTSAGNPKTWTSFLHEKGAKVAHVVSSARFATKSEEAGVDIVVAEGFEAGGHNGLDETTTMCLIREVRAVTHLPLLAAGGIASGQAMMAAMALEADGVQIGTLFALTEESSAHENFKERCLQLSSGDTGVGIRHFAPIRMVKNQLYIELDKAESQGAEKDELNRIMGKGKARMGIFEGNLDNGALEIGQAASQLKNLKSVNQVMRELLDDYVNAFVYILDNSGFVEGLKK